MRRAISGSTISLRTLRRRHKHNGDGAISRFACEGASEDEMRRAIERATPRLLEIAIHWPAAERRPTPRSPLRKKAKEDADPRPDLSRRGGITP